MKREVNSCLAAARDLKAPWSSVRQLALVADSTDDLDLHHHCLSDITHLADQALRQVNDLIRLEALATCAPTLEPVCVRSICDDVYHELTPLLRPDQHGLELIYRNRSRIALANSELLHSIIYHFCINALEYSSPEAASRLLISNSGNKIRIDVRDFGPALPDHIWHEFEKRISGSPISIPMRPGSSSIGLYISSNFAHLMNTEVGAIRHRDGTSLYIELPTSAQTTLF